MSDEGSAVPGCGCVACKPNTMTCSYCLKRKAWPDAYPSTIYSVCWDCRWKEHVRLEHKLSLVGRWKARRRAIRTAAASVLRDEAVERSERMIPTPTPVGVGEPK